ncbi:hypothetical protein BKA83DRAFT_680330 [Pisolithus microcarpus]|nr:hypothetical protein BKA83DRAFT_680330 [Pisolithus microcarpus]
MVACFRLRLFSSHFLHYLSCAFLAALAIPGAAAKYDTIVASNGEILQRLQDPNVAFINSNGTIIVYSLTTGEEIPQGLASDGSGSGLDACALAWIVFSFTVGLPLLFLGIRGWRFTTAAAIGLAATLTSWAVFVNTLDNLGVSDVALTIFVLSLFGCGFLLGSLELSRVLGILVLGDWLLGFESSLLGSGLLISDPSIFFVNWLIVGLCGFMCSILVLWKQRFGVLNGCASTGSFLCALGVDLVTNRQSGMSRGLRYLMDRNRYHVVDNVFSGYSPPTTTVIILAVSIAVTPAFAFAQHKVFKRPFWSVTTQCDMEMRKSATTATSSRVSSAMPETPISVKSPFPSDDEKKLES